MINKLVNTIRQVNKNTILKDLAIDESNGRVKRMRAIEKIIKDTYKIDPEVVYIDERYKPLFHKSSIKGSYTSAKHMVIVYLNNDYRANLNTLCHELTHSYQHTHLTKQYEKSCKDLKEGRVSYKNAWHEVDARQQAAMMSSYYCSLRRVA